MARGHKMERKNYIDKLKHLKLKGGANAAVPNRLPSLAIDTECEKATQTNRGFFIDEFSIPLHHRGAEATETDRLDQGKKQASLIGCVNIDRRDLIPDGHGGYFVHIAKKEIQRSVPNEQRERHKSNNRKHPANQPNGPPRLQRHAYPNAPYPNAPYIQRPRLDSRWDGRNNSLPMASNNLTEDLLRMQEFPNVRMKRPNATAKFSRTDSHKQFY